MLRSGEKTTQNSFYSPQGGEGTSQTCHHIPKNPEKKKSSEKKTDKPARDRVNAVLPGKIKRGKFITHSCAAERKNPK